MTTSASPRDWPEDFPHENGNYICGCIVCKERFIGHKRRITCKVCATAYETEAQHRTEWLRAHNAPADWTIVTEGEALLTQADLMRLVWDNSKMKRALEDISTTAHCIAKAGPLNTPDLATAWKRFMEINAKATAALSAKIKT